MWNIPVEEAEQRAIYSHEAGVVGNYRCFDNAISVLRRLSRLYDLVIVTSRRATLRLETDAWLEKHFPGLFKQIRYVGMWDADQDFAHKIKQTKTEICREIGTGYLIDDQLKHCISAAEAGIEALLFGNYAWNRHDAELPRRITRVRNWEDIARYFNVQD
ncbi:MAG TPA: hypothetical protein VJ836_03550 [Candidatus Saccharimonadales bacterium]|nr:hypothetical protein [Candidatus Saccharimonadales bacterium]